MKKFLITLCLVLLTSYASAEIVNTHGENRVANYLKQLSNTLEGARENGTRIYNDIKTYITDHSGQFKAADRVKLNNLQTKLIDVQNAINDFITAVETDFPGVK